MHGLRSRRNTLLAAIAGRRHAAAAQFSFEWTERGGPAVTEPRPKGFGSRLIERFLGAGMG